jgi:hypothetical protein
MTIERKKGEIIIRIPSSVDVREIQDVLDFIRFKELTSSFTVKQTTVNKLASSINSKWWKKNAKKILNEGSR